MSKRCRLYCFYNRTMRDQGEIFSACFYTGTLYGDENDNCSGYFKPFRSKYYPVDVHNRIIYNDPQPTEGKCSINSNTYRGKGTIGIRGKRILENHKLYRDFQIFKEHLPGIRGAGAPTHGRGGDCKAGVASLSV